MAKITAKVAALTNSDDTFGPTLSTNGNFISGSMFRSAKATDSTANAVILSSPSCASIRICVTY